VQETPVPKTTSVLERQGEMEMKWSKIAGLLMAVCVMAAGNLSAAEKAVERVGEAAKVLAEVMGTPEHAIPIDLFNKSECIAILPGVKKAGLGVGGQYGKGVLSCRVKEGKEWSGPSTVRIEGGSFGLQIGGSSTDLVLLILNERGAEKLLQSKFTVGVDAAAAAGPVGRDAKAETDVQMHAEILSYSRSRGAFAGISLDGSTLRQDADDNKAIYGKDVTPQQIISGAVPPPDSVQPLMDALKKYSPVKAK
jgi:lipid-binding SYLF domain-containing protein